MIIIYIITHIYNALFTLFIIATRAAPKCQTAIF